MIMMQINISEQIFTPHVVINSIINPDSVIKISTCWSKNVKDISKYKNLDSFTATVYKDDIRIFKGKGFDGKLISYRR